MVPITSTICSTVAQPCGPGPGGAPCPVSYAVIATDDTIVLLPGIETVVDFNVDVSEFGGDDADSLNDRIVVGHDDVYAVGYTATYGIGADGDTITARIKVDGVTQVTIVTVLGAAPTPVSELNNILLSAGQALTVTVETNALEGATVLSASLAAVRVCGPAADVIVPQG
jgi:hypothetical protein